MQRQGSPPPTCNVFLSVVVTSAVYLKTPLCLPLSPSSGSPSVPFPSISFHYLTPSPFPSLCLSLSLPPSTTTTTTSFLFLQCSPPPLSCVYCSRKSSTDTSMCVFVHVCATTVNPASEPHTIMSKAGGFNPCDVSNDLIKTLIADALHHSHANKNPLNH